MMYKIGVIGDRASVLGFMAVGFAVRPVATAVEAAAELKKLASQNFAVIFITEGIAQQIEEDILRYRDSALPAVIAIPSKSGPTGYGMAGIKRSVEHAVGADILFNDKQ